jgi:hypothetical protein
MSAITRGVVAAVLLAGAVAGAAAFPHFLAGPDGGQTAQVALLPEGNQPVIVHAATLPRPVIVPATVARAFAVRIAPLPANLKPKPVVIHRIAPPSRVAPEPAPAPAPAPASAPAPAVVQVTASAVIPVAAAAAAPTPIAAPVQPSPSHDNGNGNGKDHAKKQERVVAAVQPLPSTSNGAPAQQTPSGTASSDSGAVRPVETPDAQAAPPDHGHGPPPWANGGGKGN